jgi:urease accessory protein
MNKKICMIVLAGSFSADALAHTGAGSVHGFAAGFLHPLLGPDHLLTMLAVGLWAAYLRGRALWLLPSAFLGVMALGAGLRYAGLVLPFAEGLVALSVAVMGVALWRNWRAASVLAGAVVGGFALFHGYVHAAEIGGDMDAAVYASGFLAATALLHGLGIVAGWAGRGFDAWRRAFGLVCAGVGAYLLAGV